MVVNKQEIPYRKQLSSNATKQLGRGGPRDMQRKQGVGSAEINMPKVNMEALKEVLLNNKESRKELKAEIFKEMEEARKIMASSDRLEGIGLPFEVVEQKIKEAVESTERSMRERYESGLGNLNTQLNDMKIQNKELNTSLAERKQEIIELKKQIYDKNEFIKSLQGQQNEEVGDLKSKIVDLIDKIKTGKITSDNYYAARPLLDDKIFIDPLSEVTTVLDSHINIDTAEDKGLKRDLKSDVEKLKGLLDNKRHKTSKTRVE